MSQHHPNDPSKSSGALSKIGSGPLVVVGILVVAIAAASISVWHQWSQGRETIAYFGSQSAYDIRHASQVEWKVIERREVEASNSTDISKVAGLVHFRQALIEDTSYEGQVPLEQAKPVWQYMVFFRDSPSATPTRLLFDLENAWVGLPDKDTVLAAKPIAAGLRRFFADIKPVASP